MTTSIIIFLLALAPAAVWFVIFNKENPERLASSLFALVAWWLSTLPVLFYQKLWGYEGNFIFFKLTPVNFQDNIISLFWFSSFNSATQAASSDYFGIAVLALFSAFIWVWFLEELFKHVVINPRFVYALGLATLWIMFYQFFLAAEVSYTYVWTVGAYLVFLYFMPRVIRFKSIDDAISLAIIAAIWFSFVENLIYFWFKWESIEAALWINSFFQAWAWEIIKFLGFVFIRVSVVTMIHVLCSWVFWYHFWLAHFAKPELIQEMRDWRTHKVLDYLHAKLKISNDNLFVIEQLIKALWISILLHWIYDLVVQINLTLFWIPLIILIMPIYFFWGFLYLFALLEDKNNKREIWVLHIREEYEK